MLILRKPWENQPPVGTGLNLSSWQTDRLGRCWPLSGNAREELASQHGTLTSGAYFSASSDGLAATFDGSDDYIALGSANLAIGNSFTFSAWVYLSDISSRQTIFGSENTGAVLNIEVGNAAGAGGTGAFGVIYPGFEICRTGSGVLALNTWAHVAYVKSTSGVGGNAVYVNGAPVSLSSDVSSGFTDSSQTFTFGRRSAGNQLFNGKLRDVRIYRYPLSASQVAALRNEKFAAFEPQNLYIPTSIVSGAYTLNLETGVYSFTGSSATLTKDSKLTLDSGTYTLSGSNASLLKGLILEASSGSYSLTGSDASLIYTHLLNASSGSYSITGSNATLTYTPTSGAYTLNLESGAYLLTGSDVTFISSGAEVTIKAGSWIRYRIIT